MPYDEYAGMAKFVITSFDLELVVKILIRLINSSNFLVMNSFRCNTVNKYGE